MGRGVGNLAFRRELDDHELRIGAIEEGGGGGGDGSITFRDEAEQTIKAHSLLVGDGLELDAVDAGVARIRGGVRVEDPQEGIGFDHVPGLGFGDGILLSGLDGDGQAFIEIDPEFISPLTLEKEGGESGEPKTLEVGNGLQLTSPDEETMRIDADEVRTVLSRFFSEEDRLIASGTGILNFTLMTFSMFPPFEKPVGIEAHLVLEAENGADLEPQLVLVDDDDEVLAVLAKKKVGVEAGKQVQVDLYGMFPAAGIPGILEPFEDNLNPSIKVFIPFSEGEEFTVKGYDFVDGIPGYGFAQELSAF